MSYVRIYFRDLQSYYRFGEKVTFLHDDGRINVNGQGIFEAKG